MLSVLRTAVKGIFYLLLTVLFCLEPLHQVNIFCPSFKTTDDNRCRVIEVGCGNMRGSKFDTDPSRHLSAVRHNWRDEPYKEEEDQMLESK